MRKSLEMMYSRFRSPVGDIHLLASRQGLAAVYFPAQVERIESRLSPNGRQRGHGNISLLQAEAFLACYFDGDLDYVPHVDLDLRGTPFQVQVWRALIALPPGQRTSYLDLANRLGRPEAVRAVAGAVARNPVSILIPCHRVVGSGGSLTGYAGGLPIKQQLLDHESRYTRALEAPAA